MKFILYERYTMYIFTSFTRFSRFLVIVIGFLPFHAIILFIKIKELNAPA